MAGFIWCIIAGTHSTSKRRFVYLMHPVVNAPERPEYAEVLRLLQPVLDGLPQVVVAIDGAPGVGKTTLGRFLAWRFNISLIETDLFLIGETGAYKYREHELRDVLTTRLERQRPAIFEGVVALRLLEQFGIEPAFHIHVICKDAEQPNYSDWFKYVTDYNPETNAHLVLSLPADEKFQG